MPWLVTLLTSLVGSFLGRVLSGAGLGLVTFAALTPVVLSALNKGAQKFNGITGTVLNIMLLSGLGVGLSIIGSAIVARVAVEAGKVAVSKMSK